MLLNTAKSGLKLSMEAHALYKNLATEWPSRSVCKVNSNESTPNYLSMKTVSAVLHIGEGSECNQFRGGPSHASPSLPLPGATFH